MQLKMYGKNDLMSLKFGNKFDGKPLRVNGLEVFAFHTFMGRQSSFVNLSKRLNSGFQVKFVEGRHAEFYDSLKKLDKENKKKGINTNYGTCDIFLIRKQDKFIPVIAVDAGFMYCTIE